MSIHLEGAAVFHDNRLDIQHCMWHPSPFFWSLRKVKCGSMLVWKYIACTGIFIIMKDIVQK